MLRGVGASAHFEGSQPRFQRPGDARLRVEWLVAVLVCPACDRAHDSRCEMAGAQLVRDLCSERVQKERESLALFSYNATRRVSLCHSGHATS